MIQTTTEKIGTTEVYVIRSLGRGLYLRLDKALVDAYNLKRGDHLKVKIEEVVSREV